MIFGYATREHEYRERSNKTTMHGVTLPSWKCKICKNPKPLKGRKSLGYKQGFACAECAKKL